MVDTEAAMEDMEAGTEVDTVAVMEDTATGELSLDPFLMLHHYHRRHIVVKYIPYPNQYTNVSSSC